ncbi:MAG: LuxR C-terminal-related transcriptional regulator [Anaerocolumna sp.]
MTDKEWKLFNDVLLEIYYQEDIRQFGGKCLKLMKLFIPYTQGYFVVIQEDGTVDKVNSVFENVSGEKQCEYIETYYAVDYLTFLYHFSKSIAYRDSDLLNDKNRMNSKMYQGFIKPQELDLGCGLIIMWDGRVRVLLNLLRSAGEPDISDHEMEFLHVFLEHFEKNIIGCMDAGKIQPKKKTTDMKVKLSERELEIAYLILDGYSNQEIGDKLGISQGTVKNI